VFVKILEKISKSLEFLKKLKIQIKSKNQKIKSFKKIKIELFDIGMERNITEANFWFVLQKVYFLFLECRNRVCVHAGFKLGATNSKNIEKM
jgi:hypothetical protein